MANDDEVLDIGGLVVTLIAFAVEGWMLTVAFPTMDRKD